MWNKCLTIIPKSVSGRAGAKLLSLHSLPVMVSCYLEGHPSLKSLILFTNADAGTAYAFIEQNDAPAAGNLTFFSSVLQPAANTL
jgi:hypothetical protein